MYSAGKTKFLGDGYKLLIIIIRGMYFSLEIKDFKSNFSYHVPQIFLKLKVMNFSMNSVLR